MTLIYLDFNRTTAVAPSVVDAMSPYWTTHFLLPTQSHVHAMAVSEAIQQAREQVAGLLNAEPSEIVFTGGGTEANNLGVLGNAAAIDATAIDTPFIDTAIGKARPHALLSAIEHDSVADAVMELGRRGWEIGIVGCDEDGVCDIDRFESMMRPTTKLACLQLANPVVGTIQSVRSLADRCHNRGIRIHCDATSAAAHIPVDATALRVDTLSISGHKMYGPKGCGALFVRRGLDLRPITFGESREMGLRAGGENVPCIVGLGAAAMLASRCVAEAHSTLEELRARLIDGLRSILGDTMQVLAEHVEGLPNTVAIELPGDAQRIQKGARQLVVSTAQSVLPPDEMTRVLRALGRTDPQIGRTLRISVGWTTSREQIDRAINLLAEATECPTQ